MSKLTGNWVSESSNTIGSGAITVTGAVMTNLVRFTDALPAGEVWYSIVDGVNREAGSGTFNGTNRITRNNIKATLVDGVFNDDNPEPIHLSGYATVSCTMNAAAFNELWDHTTDNTNPHNVIAWQVSYNSNDDPISDSDTVSAALIDHGEALVAHSVDNTNPHDVRAEQVSYDNSIDIITTADDVQEAMEDHSVVIKTKTPSNSGIISGGELTVDGLSTFSIDAGSGIVYDSYTAPEDTTTTFVNWGPMPAIPAVMSKGAGYTTIFLTDNAEVLQISGKPTYDIYRDNIYLGMIFYARDEITEVVTASAVVKQTATDNYDAMLLAAKVNGATIEAVTSELKVWMDQATIISPGTNRQQDLKNPNIRTVSAEGDSSTAIQFHTMTRTGLTDPTQVEAIPKFVNLTGDAITALTGTEAVVHRLYRLGINNPVFALMYGQNVYPDAEDAAINYRIDDSKTDFPDETQDTFFAGHICVSPNATDFTDDNLAWIISTTQGQVQSSPTVSLSHTTLTDRDQPDQHPIEAISGLQSELNGKVSKTGDTMTGQLVVDFAGQAIRLGGPATANQGCYIYGLAVDGLSNGWYIGRTTLDNDIRLYNYVDDADIYLNTLGAGLVRITNPTSSSVQGTNTSSLTRKDYVDGVAAGKSDTDHTHTGYVSKTGDTMTGQLTVDSDGRAIQIGGPQTANKTSYIYGLALDGTSNGWLLGRSTLNNDIRLYNYVDDADIYLTTIGDALVRITNPTSSSVQGTNTSSLTRKDYVDGVAAGKSDTDHTHSEYAPTDHTHSGYLSTSGGSMFGHISGIAPTSDAHLTRKDYVDDAIANMDAFPSGTTLPFYDTGCAPGWVSVTDPLLTDRMMRVVSSGGGSYAGSDSPIINDKVSSHTHTYSSVTSYVGNHTHVLDAGSNNYFVNGIDPNSSSGVDGSATPDLRSANSVGSSGAGAHDHDVSGTTAGNTGSGDWKPRYANFILCRKA